MSCIVQLQSSDVLLFDSQLLEQVNIWIADNAQLLEYRHIPTCAMFLLQTLSSKKQDIAIQSFINSCLTKDKIEKLLINEILQIVLFLAHAPNQTQHQQHQKHNIKTIMNDISNRILDLKEELSKEQYLQLIGFLNIIKYCPDELLDELLIWTEINIENLSIGE